MTQNKYSTPISEIHKSIKSVIQMSYDIVKAHVGELLEETKEGEARPDDPVGRGTTFIIQLPI
jgi:hypothetical protein